MKFLAKNVFIILTIITQCAISCSQADSSEGSNKDLELPNKTQKKEKATSLNYPLNDSESGIEFTLPEGYNLFSKAEGDLNGDGKDDVVLITKGTQKDKVVINRFNEEVDRNRRGILIYLTDGDKTNLETENLKCFLSENEDGGVYFPPELSVEIEYGNLFVHYNHGRYGFWKYTFRHQDSSFELIGYDASSNFGPIVLSETSINYLTKRKLTRVNINQDADEGGEEVFEETWENILFTDLVKLSEIRDFEMFDPEAPKNAEEGVYFSHDEHQKSQDSIRTIILESLPNEAIKSSLLQEIYVRGFLEVTEKNIQFSLPFNLHSFGGCLAPDCYVTDIRFSVPLSSPVTFPLKVDFSIHEHGCLPKDIFLKSSFNLVEHTDSMVNYYCSEFKSNLIIESNGGLIYFPHEQDNSLSNEAIDKMYSFEFEEGIGPEPYASSVMYKDYELK